MAPRTKEQRKQRYDLRTKGLRIFTELDNVITQLWSACDPADENTTQEAAYVLATKAKQLLDQFQALVKETQP